MTMVMSNVNDRENLARFRNTTLWAERGLISYEYADDGTYEQRRVEEVESALEAMIETVGTSAVNLGFAPDPTAYRKTMRFIEAAKRVCAMARAQGTPDNERDIEEAERRRAKTFGMPGIIIPGVNDKKPAPGKLIY